MGGSPDVMAPAPTGAPFDPHQQAGGAHFPHEWGKEGEGLALNDIEGQGDYTSIIPLHVMPKHSPGNPHS